MAARPVTVAGVFGRRLNRLICHCQCGLALLPPLAAAIGDFGSPGSLPAGIGEFRVVSGRGPQLLKPTVSRGFRRHANTGG